jgi:hypothetical protein
VKRIRAKQAAFLRGRAIGQLSIDELLWFGQLAQAERILVRTQMKPLDSSSQFIHWAAEACCRSCFETG